MARSSRHVCVATSRTFNAWPSKQGKATWGRLLELGVVKEQTRCNVLVLGIAARLQTSSHLGRGDASAMMRAALLEPETHRKSLAHWRMV